jgi:hypothetical protein
MSKPRRTAPELRQAIMQEVRRRPEWNAILNVTISRRVHCECGIGPRVAPEGAVRLVANLQNEFDLE